MKVTKLSYQFIIFGMMASLAACANTTDSNNDAGPNDDGSSIEPKLMFDNLEDGDDAINTDAGLAGDWYSFNDGTDSGVQTPSDDFLPEEGGPEGSSFAIHTTGSGFTSWGAGIGFDLNGSDPTSTELVKGAWDASEFEGIVFWGKGNSPIRVMTSTLAVISVQEGGLCEAGTVDDKPVEGEECDNAHGKDLFLSKEWKQYKVSFADVKQEEGWGKVIDFDASDLASVLFQVDANLDFDFWIDEVGVY